MLYVFIEIGGTGGGCFRYMYSRFLKEAAKVTSNKALVEAASIIHKSGRYFTELGQLFKDAETTNNIEEKISKAKERFLIISDIEEEAFRYLSKNISFV